MEDDSTVRKGAIDRSPRFPFIPLARALERASQFYENEKRGVAPFAAAAKHWGYSPTSSGGMQTLAALNYYGLIEGGRGALRLSELALRILLDKRPESVDRKRLMRQAALTPAIAAEVNSKWPDGLPSEATLNHFLVLDRGFNEATALKAIDIIKQNELLTVSASEYAISDDSEINMRSDMQAQTREKTAALQPTGQPPSPKNVAQQGHVEQVRVPAGQSIELRFSGEPTKKVYEFLVAYATFMADQYEAEETTPSETRTGGETT